MDRVAHSRAQDRARWLVRDHGADAESVLAAKLARAVNSPADRAFYRMISRELRVLRGLQAEAAPSPPGPLDRMLALIRGKRNRDEP